ncbi:hypothetical protein IG631_05589 [Alternaria alternata]|nr:hypothetical protein IG631_05589 [Alternaria alternata]
MPATYWLHARAILSVSHPTMFQLLLTLVTSTQFTSDNIPCLRDAHSGSVSSSPIHARDPKHSPIPQSHSPRTSNEAMNLVVCEIHCLFMRSICSSEASNPESLQPSAQRLQSYKAHFPYTEGTASCLQACAFRS